MPANKHGFEILPNAGENQKKVKGKKKKTLGNQKE
jgi:hypothetical protein